MHKQDYFSYYRQLLRGIFNRLMLILSKIDISDKELKELAEPIIDFIQMPEYLQSNNWDYAIRFFETKIQLFTSTQINKIIEVFFERYKNGGNNENLRKICNYASQKSNYKITDPFFLQKLINIQIIPCKKCGRMHNAERLLYCWYVADELGKATIREKLVEYLLCSFDEDFYQHTVFLDIFSADEHPEFLEQFISYADKVSSPFDIKLEKHPMDNSRL